MNKFTKIFLLIFIAMIFVFSLTSVVFGAGANVACDKYAYPWCSAEGLGGESGLINTIYKYSLVLVGVVALGAIIYGGILYIISAGNPSGQTEATGWITGAIWGLVLLLSAALLFNTINPQIVSLNLPKMTLKKIDIATSTVATSTVATAAATACINFRSNDSCKAQPTCQSTYSPVGLFNGCTSKSSSEISCLSLISGDSCKAQSACQPMYSKLGFFAYCTTK